MDPTTLVDRYARAGYWPGKTGRSPNGPLVGEMPLTMQSNKRLICSLSADASRKTPAPGRRGNNKQCQNFIKQLQKSLQISSEEACFSVISHPFRCQRGLPACAQEALNLPPTTQMMPPQLWHLTSCLPARSRVSKHTSTSLILRSALRLEFKIWSYKI